MATDEKVQNPEPGTAILDKEHAQAAAGGESTTPSVFVNTEPMREEQVQNAVNFLSHPRVRGSPVIYRRSFLEKKGLTRQEIDEAFRRVPDPPPTATTVPAGNANQDAQMKPSSNVQVQAPSQGLQPAVTGSVIAKAGILTRFHWSHAFLAIGLLAASGAGTAVLFKKAIIPRLKSWIRKIVFEEGDDLVKKTNSKPDLAAEAATAAKTAALAAADVAKASQELLDSKHAEKKYFEDFSKLLNVQILEMKTMSSALQKLEGKYNTIKGDDRKSSFASGKQLYVNGKMDDPVRSSSPPRPVDTSMPPHPKNFMEIMEMVQRGEKPSNIREINDLPPNPNQQPSNPRLAPRTKPWELGQAQQSSSQVFQPPYVTGGLNPRIQAGSFNYRTNDNGSESSWWQQRSAINAEIEAEDRLKTTSVTNDHPATRRWVPPQAPPLAIPEAEAAIWQRKFVMEKGRVDGGQSSVRSSESLDQLVRVTNLSETGGVAENNGVSTGLTPSEIQVEEEENMAEC